MSEVAGSHFCSNIAMNAPNWKEIPIAFNCEGSRLIGIVTNPKVPHETGVVIIVGGPQYRAGSHRQFTLLARHLADRGIASIRFDHRGTGDSEGEANGIKNLGPDIKTAADTLLAQSHAIRHIALWGLCDAASAAAIHAYTDPRIIQLILLNPWVESVEGHSRLKAYYAQRIRQPKFWTKLLSLDINILSAIKGLASDLKARYSAPVLGGDEKAAGVNRLMFYGLEAFHHETVIITGEKDLTGQYFCTLVDGNERWRQTCNSATFIVIAGADHTFSNRHWQNQVASATVNAILHTASMPRTQLSVSEPAELACDLRPITDKILEELELIWPNLAAASDLSIFQSWLWIKTWIRSLGDSKDLILFQASLRGEIIGLGIFGRATQVRHRIIRSRRLFLSETGDPALDLLTIEHNGLVIRRGLETTVWEAALNKFSTWSKTWDEIHISGISNNTRINAIRQTASSRGLLVQVELSKPYFWVDLEALQNENQSYLNKLSSNTRQQIRKSLRLYGEQGAIELSVAQSKEQALAYFDELRELHQRYWRNKGQPGAFASEFAIQFHKELITCGVLSKQVQLIKVTAGGKTVGILYNLVHAKKVSNYQAGLVYDDNPKLKPGLACHALAIEMNLAAGQRSYDFLMGDSQYKRSLSTHENNMYWLNIKRPKVKFILEEIARRTKHRFSTLSNV